MKKIFVCGTVLAMLAGCSEKPKSQEVKVLDVSCEKLITFDAGDMIVKCPISESLTEFQNKTPDAQFVQGGDFNYDNAVADQEHIYVNVVPEGAYEWATKTEYRILVKEPKFEGDNMWAVTVVVE